MSTEEFLKIFSRKGFADVRAIEFRVIANQRGKLEFGEGSQGIEQHCHSEKAAHY